MLAVLQQARVVTGPGRRSGLESHELLAPGDVVLIDLGRADDKDVDVAFPVSLATRGRPVEERDSRRRLPTVDRRA